MFLTTRWQQTKKKKLQSLSLMAEYGGKPSTGMSLWCQCVCAQVPSCLHNVGVTVLFCSPTLSSPWSFCASSSVPCSTQTHTRPRHHLTSIPCHHLLFVLRLYYLRSYSSKIGASSIQNSLESSRLGEMLATAAFDWLTLVSRDVPCKTKG